MAFNTWPYARSRFYAHRHTIGKNDEKIIFSSIFVHFIKLFVDGSCDTIGLMD
jgi:hypothetical protein